MTAPLLSVASATKRFANFTAVSDVSIDVLPGQRIGIIGPNGSGKTTLINCISGRLTPDNGTVSFAGHDVTRLQPYQRAKLGIARTFQIPQPFMGMTLAENLYVPLEYGAGGGTSASTLREQAHAILDMLGLAGKIDSDCRALSQIELRKLELARALAVRPKLLLSDEAMAGLSPAEVDEVLEILLELSSRGITVIMIEHIMRAIMRFSEDVLCLVSGRVVARGRPEEIVEDPNVRKAYIGE